MTPPPTPASPDRWDALDVLRGLSIVGMLLSLTPGAWEHEYGWMIHAKWEGWNLIDLVAPGFLFCIGAALPLSLNRRIGRGESAGQLVRHIVVRALLLVLLGLFLNAYPDFDLPHLRIPGVLQRIGLSYAVTGLFVVFTSRRADGTLQISLRLMMGGAVIILTSYWAWLYFVPVPGYGAPRFDPVGCWPAVIDRAIFTVPHLFKYWPVDGKVVFDPDGLLSIYPTCALILLGVVAGVRWRDARRPELVALIAGGGLIALAFGLRGLCPIIKNIWTSTFVLFSGGFALVLLAALTLVGKYRPAGVLLFPFRVVGTNPLLAYLICFLFGPVLDFNWIPNAAHGHISLRWGSQILLSGLDPQLSSLLFGIAYLIALFPLLWVAHRRRWILKL